MIESVSACLSVGPGAKHLYLDNNKTFHFKTFLLSFVPWPELRKTKATREQTIRVYLRVGFLY